MRIKIENKDFETEFIYVGLPPLKDIQKTINKKIKEYYERVKRGTPKK